MRGRVGAADSHGRRPRPRGRGHPLARRERPIAGSPRYGLINCGTGVRADGVWSVPPRRMGPRASMESKRTCPLDPLRRRRWQGSPHTVGGPPSPSRASPPPGLSTARLGGSPLVTSVGGQPLGWCQARRCLSRGGTQMASRPAGAGASPPVPSALTPRPRSCIVTHNTSAELDQPSWLVTVSLGLARPRSREDASGCRIDL
jgi:hypothetical protein